VHAVREFANQVKIGAIGVERVRDEKPRPLIGMTISWEGAGDDSVSTKSLKIE
jgi:hypothetical protein